jgi:integrase
MAERRQLPPQIRRVELARRSDGKPVVRYQLTVDTGIVDGRRKQFRRRYATEREAREALAEVRGQLAQGSYVQPSQLTVRQACDDWLAAKHGLKPSTVHGHRTSLTPVIVHLGDIAVQELTKRHIDDLVAALQAGGGPSPRGKSRKPWKPRTVNYMLSLLTAVLEDQMRQGHLVRNVAALVTRVPSDQKPPRTLTAAEVSKVLNHIDGDRYAAAWHLALSGLRRGEIAALRWSDIDLNSGTIAITRNRLRFADKVVEGTVKSKASDRKLPLPDNLAATLKAAKSLQAADKLSLGAAYQSSGYVVVDEAGRPLSPHALTSRWARMLVAAGVLPVRLHDARHTCGTLMHLEGVPIAVIAAWLGHASSAFTMATYVHSQEPALADAARRLARVVTNS